MTGRSSGELWVRYLDAFDRWKEACEISHALIKLSRRITSESRVASKRYAEWRRTSGIGDSSLTYRNLPQAPGQLAGLNPRSSERNPGITPRQINPNRESVELTVRFASGARPAGSQKGDRPARQQKVGDKPGNIQISSSSIMLVAVQMSPRERAEKLFRTCFTAEELEFLKRQASFIGAIGRIEKFEDALNAVETGERLIKETWNKAGHTDSEFTPRDL